MSLDEEEIATSEMIYSLHLTIEQTHGDHKEDNLFTCHLFPTTA